MEAAARALSHSSSCSFLPPEVLHGPSSSSSRSSPVVLRVPLTLRSTTRRSRLSFSPSPSPSPLTLTLTLTLTKALPNGSGSGSGSGSSSTPSGAAAGAGAGADSPDFSLPPIPIDFQVPPPNFDNTINGNSYPFPTGPALSGSRAGLFRTPISGGVHSATSAHDLPPPALAVRNLMEQARFAHLSTTMSKMHHRRAGYPFGSLVDFAPDSMGHPIFSLSPLAIHTRNLLADPRCTLVVQIPGWSGLSNARVTIFGDVVPLSAEQQDWARQQYIAKHQQWASQQWGNFYYYRMQTISDIYFIGGFGTVAWVDVKAYETTNPDKIAATGGEQNLKELNAMFSKPLRELLSAEVEIDDAALISVDSKGTDIRVRQGAQFNIQRLSFEVEHPVDTLEEAKKALQKIIKKGCKPKLQK